MGIGQSPTGPMNRKNGDQGATLAWVIDGYGLAEGRYPLWNSLLEAILRDGRTRLHFSSAFETGTRKKTLRALGDEFNDRTVQAVPAIDDDSLARVHVAKDLVYFCFGPWWRDTRFLPPNQFEGKRVAALPILAGRDLNRDLQALKNNGISLILSEYLEDELPGSLGSELRSYFRDCYLFIPPLVEMECREGRNRQARQMQQVFFVFDSNEDGESSGDLTPRVEELKEALTPVAEFEFIDLSKRNRHLLNRVKACLPKAACVVSDVGNPQWNLCLHTMARHFGREVLSWGDRRDSPFRFLSCGFPFSEWAGSRVSPDREDLGRRMARVIEHLNPISTPTVRFDVTEGAVPSWSTARILNILESTLSGQAQCSLGGNAWADFVNDQVYRRSVHPELWNGCSKRKRIDRHTLSENEKALLENELFARALAAFCCEESKGPDSGLESPGVRTLRRLLSSLYAREVLSHANEHGWLEWVFTALNEIPNFPEHCLEAIEYDYQMNPRKRDLYAGFGGLLINSYLRGRWPRPKRALLEIVDNLISRERDGGTTDGMACLLEARLQMLRGNPKTATRLVEKAYSEWSHLRDGFSHLGIVLYEQGRLSEAARLFARDAKTNRQSGRIKVLYADILGRLSRLDEAYLEIELAYASDLTRNGAFTRVAAGLFDKSFQRYLRSGLTPEIRHELNRCLSFLDSDTEMERSTAQTWLLLGKIHVLLDRMADADHAITSMYENHAEASDGFSQLGATCMGRGRDEQALRYFERDLREGRMRDPISLIRYARLLGGQGEMEKAAEFVVQAYRNSTDLRGAYSEVAQSAFETLYGRWIEARDGRVLDGEIRLLERFVRRDMDENRQTASTFMLAAKLCLMREDTAAAIALVDQLYLGYPDESGAFSQLGSTVAGRRQLKEAEAFYRRDLETGRGRPDLNRIRQAGVVAAQGRRQEAELMVDSVYRVDPGIRGGLTIVAYQCLLEVMPLWRDRGLVEKIVEELRYVCSLLERDLALERASNDTKPHLARARYLLGEQKEAEETISDYYRENEERTDGFAALAQLARYEGDYNRACALFEKDFRANRLTSPFIRHYTDLLTLTGRTNEALEIADQDGQSVAWSALKLRRALHDGNPYAEFDPEKFPVDISGWHANTEIMCELVEQCRPSLIIEVGSWKGASAIAMAEEVRRLGLGSCMVCVDTWLGALEFWLNHEDPTRYGSLRFGHGYPGVYYQFLANVCHRKLQDYIIPFPQTSVIAAQWFRLNRVGADLIYVDGSHTYDDVSRDLQGYWRILSPNGIMFGDDYGQPEVAEAVNTFCHANHIACHQQGEYWVLSGEEENRQQAGQDVA